MRKEEKERKCPACGDTECRVDRVEHVKVVLEKSAWELRKGEDAAWYEEREAGRGYVDVVSVGVIAKIGTWYAWGYSVWDLPPPDEDEPSEEEGWRGWEEILAEEEELSRFRASLRPSPAEPSGPELPEF